MNDDQSAGSAEPVGDLFRIPVPPAHAVPPASAPELRTLVSLAVAAVVIATLYVAQDVLIPITLAVMLSFVLSPLVDVLRRIGVWRGPAVGISVVVALGGIGLIAILLGSQAAALGAEVPRYVETIQGKVQGIQAVAARRLAIVTQMIGSRPAGEAPPASATAPPPRTTAEVSGLPGGTPEHPIVVELARPRASAVNVVRAILEPVLGPLETTVIVLIVTIFILMQREDLRDRFIRLFGARDLHRTTVAMDDAGTRLSRYFVSQLGVNTCFGLVVGIGLWLIGVPSPALWGVLAGLLRFVPYVGALLAAAAPLALAAGVDPGWWMTVRVALLFLIVEPLTGYVVEPLLYGHSTGLSPVSVIVAAVFWTWLWGPVGLILSTPLTLCLVVMGRHVKSLEFFDVLLGDRPALSDVDRFYQRTLANDPDEALDQADKMLADRSLTEYYDGVVLEGLKLAGSDQARGTLTPERASEMARSILAVIADLDGHGAADQSRATHAGPAVVACIAGRGPFDDVLSAMLAQLLTHRGLRARRVPHTAVARDRIAELNLSGIKVVVLSYLELEASPAHLRYLIRRLRHRAPQAVIIAGLWPAGDAVLNDQRAQQELGADRCVGSLADAVEAAVAAAASRDETGGVLPPAPDGMWMQPASSES